MLLNRLIKYDTFSEDVTKFYMAECILAIEAVHNLGFIHRYVGSQFFEPSTRCNTLANLSTK
jgi:serine/threonine protein kinase